MFAENPPSVDHSPASVLNRVAARLYARLGHRYRWVFGLCELVASVLVASVAVVLMLSYYRHTTAQFWLVYGVVNAAVLLGTGLALWRGLGVLAPAMLWLRQPPGTSTPAEAAAAWDAATNYPMRSFRANLLLVALLAAVPTVVFITAELGLAWTAVPVLLVAAAAPIAYGTAVNYAIAELLIRPLVSHVAATLSEDFPFRANGLLLHRRLELLLPIFTTFAGLVIAALMHDGGGTAALAESLAAAIVIGLVFSFGLTVLLSRAVTGPVSELRSGLARVRAEDYTARVPVLSSDELGELSHDFNLMAAGLEERERIRAAFGTYLDQDIVPLILSGRFPDSGVEVTVSVMFVDVRGFTSFAEGLSPTEVVAALNALFELIVPVIAEHGGHVDKFLGDGLLAVFGAPEGFTDHADRALSAGVAIARALARARLALSVGIGINSGPVVAGSIGGAGRLNFSVIGDVVNVAARVEAATRSTGDTMLITAETREFLTRTWELEPRGSFALKGKLQPVEILACPAAEHDAPSPDGASPDAAAPGAPTLTQETGPT